MVVANSETLEQQIGRVATAHKIATTSLYNLVMSESSLDPLADNGYDRGLVQINRNAWPEITDEQAFDPEFSLHFAAQKISESKGDIWVAGNCYLFVKALLGKIPRMSEINPNTEIPRVGDVAIFYYKGKKHIAVEDEILEDGFFVRESNYEPYKIGRRFIKWNDPAFAGFHSLPESFVSE